LRRVRRPLLVLLTTIALAGCGTEEGEAPPVEAVRPAFSFVPESLPEHGVSFDRPKDWQFARGQDQLLATISAGRVTIAIWRYPRTEPLPTTPEELEMARDALVGAAKARDTTFRVIQAKGTRAARSPAVVVVADETIGGEVRRVRSTHVYAHGGEVVVDAFAPPRDYPKVEDPVFRKVVRSLRVTAPQ
jgi:hypothetical protein